MRVSIVTIVVFALFVSSTCSGLSVESQSQMSMSSLSESSESDSRQRRVMQAVSLEAADEPIEMDAIEFGHDTVENEAVDDDIIEHHDEPHREQDDQKGSRIAEDDDSDSDSDSESHKKQHTKKTQHSAAHRLSGGDEQDKNDNEQRRHVTPVRRSSSTSSHSKRQSQSLPALSGAKPLRTSSGATPAAGASGLKPAKIVSSLSGAPRPFSSAVVNSASLGHPHHAMSDGEKQHVQDLNDPDAHIRALAKDIDQVMARTKKDHEWVKAVQKMIETYRTKILAVRASLRNRGGQVKDLQRQIRARRVAIHNEKLQKKLGAVQSQLHRLTGDSMSVMTQTANLEKTRDELIKAIRGIRSQITVADNRS
jgi:hypothetical protein